MTLWRRWVGGLTALVALATWGPTYPATAGDEASAEAGNCVLIRCSCACGLTDVCRDLKTTVTQSLGADWQLVAVPKGSTAEKFLAKLRKDGRVLAATLDLGVGEIEGAPATLPAGGLMLSTEIPTQPELLRIGATAAAGRASGAGVRVAVIDSGVISHAALANHVDGDGYDFVQDDADPTDEQNGLDDDDDGNVDEEFAHGTFVASLILALAPDVHIVPFRVLDADGIGTSSSVVRAIVAAVDADVNVINLSLHVPDGDSAIRSAIAYAAGRGVQVVVAAGNTGHVSASVPLSGEGVLMVTAVGQDDALAEFATLGQAVSLSAPGIDISGAYPHDDPDTAVWSGTSFSAALVSATCALLIELHPTWAPADVKDRILGTAVDNSAVNPGVEEEIGAGRLDLDAATDE